MEWFEIVILKYFDLVDVFLGARHQNRFNFLIIDLK